LIWERDPREDEIFEASREREAYMKQGEGCKSGGRRIDMVQMRENPRNIQRKRGLYEAEGGIQVRWAED
jgi:hypothetical protein